jgi:hypothetical protein
MRVDVDFRGVHYICTLLMYRSSVVYPNVELDGLQEV